MKIEIALEFKNYFDTPKDFGKYYKKQLCKFINYKFNKPCTEVMHRIVLGSIDMRFEFSTEIDIYEDESLKYILKSIKKFLNSRNKNVYRFEIYIERDNEFISETIRNI